MLVPGLQNELLFKMASGSDAVLSDVHKSLRECAQEMLDKYKRQLMSTRETGKREKLGIKTHATEILLDELNKVPKDSDAIHETIASALERHAKALQGHEHLLSRKGNTYALMQQTKGLRRRHDAPASLLQYHDLKDKLPGDDTPLMPEIKEPVSTVDQMKNLKMQPLAALDEQHRTEETLCDEEKIECPGKCIDENTNEVLRIQKKRLADHSKECSKHFKCDNCAERFPCNTETGYLKQFQIHMRNHDTDQSALSGFLTSLINKVLPQQELLLHKEVIPQTEHTGFRVPFTGWDRDGNYRFDGTDCVRTPQDWVYQSKANPRHFFVTLESPPDQSFYHQIILPFQKYSECYRKTMDMTLKICFSADDGMYFRNALKSWTVDILHDKHDEKPQSVHVTSYNGREVDMMSLLDPGDDYVTYTAPYEGNCYLFKISI